MLNELMRGRRGCLCRDPVSTGGNGASGGGETGQFNTIEQAMSITLGGICWKGGDPPETKLLQARDFHSFIEVVSPGHLRAGWESWTL